VSDSRRRRGVWAVPQGCGLRDNSTRSVNGANVAEGASPLSFKDAIDRGAGDAEQVGQFHGGLLAALEQGHQVRLLALVELGLLPPQRRPLALASLIPSRVRSLIKSDSNSATLASTLNSNRPTGSVGSYTDPPRFKLTCRTVSSSAMALASGSERASRSSLVATSVSPSRHAASASRSPGRSRLLPVSP